MVKHTYAFEDLRASLKFLQKTKLLLLEENLLTYVTFQPGLLQFALVATRALVVESSESIASPEIFSCVINI